MLPQKPTIRQPRACSYCRGKKIRCDGDDPCGNCLDHRQKCVYLPAKRRGRKHHRVGTPRAGAILSPTNTVERTEAESVPVAPFVTTLMVNNNISVPSPPGALPPIVAAPTLPGAQESQADSPVELRGSVSYTAMKSPVGLQHHQNHLLEKRTDPQKSVLTPRETDIDREEAVIDIKQINWEHHGPSSWLSICSKPGIQWVASKADTSQFGSIAHALVMDWTKNLTVGQKMGRETYPEPDVETASRYVSCYFDHSHDIIFGTVPRLEFETQLRAHFQGLQPDDSAQYALRNAIYAVGCRAAALDEPSVHFTETLERSLKYFHNAFSVYIDLLYMPSGLTAVKALVVMTSYAELLGSPAVEYMLASSAARLAQSKGLHRQPSKRWNLHATEIIHRNCIFWTIYCYDKYISLRSGRPSILNDDDISCEVPADSPEGTMMDMEVFSAVVNHAKICSGMVKQLFTAEAFTKTAEVIFHHIGTYETKLQAWRSALPPDLRLESTIHGFSARRKFDAIRLHTVYYGSIIALHANIHYPWLNASLLRHRQAAYREQAAHSSTEVATASRQLLLSLKNLIPDMISLSPLVFYYPMLATINLFIHILKTPTAPTVQSDLALLDIASGHFGHIYHQTSSRISFSFPRDATRLAERAVQVARVGDGRISRDDASTSTPAVSSEVLFDLRAEDWSQGSMPDFWDGLPAGFFDDFIVAGDMIAF